MYMIPLDHESSHPLCARLLMSRLPDIGSQNAGDYCVQRLMHEPSGDGDLRVDYGDDDDAGNDRDDHDHDVRCCRRTGVLVVAVAAVVPYNVRVHDVHNVVAPLLLESSVRCFLAPYLCLILMLILLLLLLLILHSMLKPLLPSQHDAHDDCFRSCDAHCGVNDDRRDVHYPRSNDAVAAADFHCDVNEDHLWME